MDECFTRIMSRYDEASVAPQEDRGREVDELKREVEI